MRFSCSVLVMVLVSAMLQAGENWPAFRGPNGAGLSDSRGVPTRWSETENIRWKTAIHGKAWSSPVIWGEQIWLTTARADGKERAAICLDRKSGKILHAIKLFPEEKPAFCIPFNSYASCTPVIEEGRVYIHFGSSGTACLDTATGKVLWERKDLPCDHHRGPGSSPILHDKLLVLTFDGFDQQYVTALDKATGKTIWKKERTINYISDDGDIKKGYSTPSILEIDGRAQLVSPAAEATIAYDPASGEELWRVIHGGMNEATRPLFGHGLVFLTTGHTGKLLAVPQGGKGDLTKTIAWTTKGGGPTRPSPLLVGELLFTVNDTGIASCLDAKSGKQLWQERLGGNFSASPICAAGHIYAPDQDDKTHVFEVARLFKPVAVNKLDIGCMASPAIAGDCLFLRSKTHLYCIGTR